MKLFWDSSALIKLLHYEEYSSYFAEIFNNNEHQHFASDISRVEVRHAIRRKHYEYLRSLSTTERRKKRDRILQDIHPHSTILNSWRKIISESISFLLVDPEVIHEAELLVLSSEIRSLDAIILATFQAHLMEVPETAFVSADRRQLEVAKSLGIKTLEPKWKK